MVILSHRRRDNIKFGLECRSCDDAVWINPARGLYQRQGLVNAV